MRTPRAWLLEFAPLFVLALTLSKSSAVFAQSNPCDIGPTSCERPANSRFFQMAIYTDSHSAGIGWESTLSDADVLWFREGDTSGQAQGRGVMQYNSWTAAQPLPQIIREGYDWSRILAAYIDEPYAQVVTGPPPHIPLSSSACDDRRAAIVSTKNQLISAAAALHAFAPQVRLWVNFTEKDLKWMQNASCPLDLNDSAFDVVSLDVYEVNFSSIEGHYDWFISEWPQQQIALVPGTHFRVGGDTASQAAARLQGYFDYANRMNQRCDIELGLIGRTGHYDRCRVWMVVGWLAAQTYTEYGNTYKGILHEDSAAISADWRSELSKIPRFGPRILPEAGLRALELLLN
jgi:hypothetical protein